MNDKPKGFVDYTGFKTGKVTVLSFHSWHVQPSGQRKSKWLCSCECGNEFVALGYNIKKEGHTTSCGCEKRQNVNKYWAKVKSGEWIPEKLKGEKFGRLTVQGFTRWLDAGEQRVSMWDCLCECGNSIEMRRSYLSATETPSCGCYKSEVISEARTTHGRSKGDKTYKSWLKMKERCYLDSYIEKEYYQDRGIEVCTRWLESFENFLEDMGERPDNTSIDRIDVNKGYYKENCRWADYTIQSYNGRKRSDNTSGRTGVHQLRNGNWQAIITHYKDKVILAYDVSFEDARKAREEGELKYYGVIKE